ncbi:MAG: glycosyltransferase [Candidatus Hermodarchaeota archaeon]
MFLEILMSTSNERLNNINLDLLPKIKNVRYIISHQIYDGKKYFFKNDRKDIYYNLTHSKGLSINRNNTISLASGDICLISDDDVNYKKIYLKRIIRAFNKIPDADIITFKINSNSSNSKYKKYPKTPMWHNIISSFKVSSIEIAFKLKSIKKAKLFFDTNFGIGAKYILGEENLFLIDALNHGLKVLYMPFYIVNHEERDIDIQEKYTCDRIIILGALLFRIFGIFSFFFDLCLSIAKYREYKLYLSLSKFFYFTVKGSIEALKTIYNAKKIRITNFLSIFQIFFKRLIRS